MTHTDLGSYTERARAIDVASSTASQRIRAGQNEVRLGREDARRAREERVRLIAEMRTDHKTWQEIGAVLGVTHQRAMAIAKQHDIT
jgi:hypothetical protein